MVPVLDDLIAFAVGLILIGALVYLVVVAGLVVLAIIVIVVLIWIAIVLYEAAKEVMGATRNR